MVERDGGFDEGLMVRRSPRRRPVLARRGARARVVYRADPAYRPPGAAAPERKDHPITLVLDIGQGAGLAGASGVRPFLPPLLAGALARGDIGLDFDGTSWHFLESPAFLLVVLALAVAAYVAERAGVERPRLSLATTVLAAVLGALLFAGSLAEGGHLTPVVGVVAGVACVALARAALGGLLDRRGRRGWTSPARGLLDRSPT